MNNVQTTVMMQSEVLGVIWHETHPAVLDTERKTCVSTTYGLHNQNFLIPAMSLAGQSFASLTIVRLSQPSALPQLPKWPPLPLYPRARFRDPRSLKPFLGRGQRITLPKLLNCQIRARGQPILTLSSHMFHPMRNVSGPAYFSRLYHPTA